jgi:hypothetical protein
MADASLFRLTVNGNGVNGCGGAARDGVKSFSATPAAMLVQFKRDVCQEIYILKRGDASP